MAILEVTTPRYKTSDDKMFDDLGQAEAHQAQIDNEGTIESFCAEVLDNDRTRATARRIIAEYIAYAAKKDAESDAPDNPPTYETAGEAVA